MTQQKIPQEKILTSTSIFIPAIIWLLYAIFSVPMMYPGFDVWLHLASIDQEANYARFWHIVWREIFSVLQIESPFSRARAIHATQLMIAVIALFFAARWVLTLVFAGQSANVRVLNCGAWLSVLIWMFMHGTVSAAVNSPSLIWQSWLQWYSVNYQITLPIYVFSVSALLYGLFAPSTEMQRFGKWPYFILFTLGSIAILTLHAAEAPYLIYALLIISILWFMQSKLKWQYLITVLTAASLLITLGLYFNYRLPAGIQEVMSGGLDGLINAIGNAGEELIAGLNRANASWNYWYWAALLLALSSCWTLHKLSVRSGSFKVVLFILLTVVPPIMVQFKWTSGVLAMITYPALTYRFTFSSFLFLAPAIFFVSLGLLDKKFVKPTRQALMLFVLILGVVLLSKFTEHNQVSYQYARSMAYALSPSYMHFDLKPEQKKWLDAVHNDLLSNPPEQPLCTDMFTSYYLYFVKSYTHLVLPKRLTDRVADLELMTGCNFPQDGGELLKNRGFGAVPWKF